MSFRDDEILTSKSGISTGTWSLHVDALGVATAAKTDGEADIRVGIAALTSMWTGSLSATQLRDCDLLLSRDDACAFSPFLAFAPSWPSCSLKGMDAMTNIAMLLRTGRWRRRS